ncbi:putative Universal stress protein UspA [Candidatus Hydrogenisulfobacillus filiaventi]|uniref:Putative Universal stress protein UspA n=1 Tax=Candidatus Hydrogenisulfobacillus filiaventi TaxID=2707344 RepID=A0A6F8ZJ64_9FIRM|nr:universal stress protein [Bacillota bacterium]CAB1130029.1 putative Universal stress protein UspA [Candidatus Hydrogenisulfobacillus filiaventi]
MAVTTILLASDGGPGALRAADWVRAQWAGTDAEVIVAVAEVPLPGGAYSLTIVPEGGADEAIYLAPETASELAVAALRETERHLAGMARVRGTIWRGKPVPAILTAIRQLRPGLVVVGRRNLSRGERLLLGSVSAGVVAHSPVPVLVVPPAVAEAVMEEPAAAGE